MLTDRTIQGKESVEPADYRYLLDTSALKSLPAKALRRLRPPAAISSFCFYELLTHLDEDDFLRQRGTVLKCCLTRVLDDPGAALDRHFGVDPRPAQAQVSAGFLIRVVLDHLSSSETLSSFYSHNVLDDKGNERLLRDVVHRTRNILQQEELRFVRFLQEAIEVLKGNPIDLASDRECNDVIMSLVYSQVEKLRRKGVHSPDIAEVDDLSYLYYGYIFERAVHYSSRNGRCDPNDYEDASIIMHMRLTQPSVLVTEDTDTIDAMRKVLARLTALGFGDDYHVGQGRILSASKLRKAADE